MSASAAGPRSDRTLSSGTMVAGGVLVGLVALFAYFNNLMYAEALEGAVYGAAYWYGTVLQAVFAIVIITVALRIGLNQGVGKQWLLVGLAVVCYALGDVAWTVLDLHLGLDPYPSIADVFYIAEYAFFLAAMVLAIRSYRALTDIKTPVAISAVIGGAAAVALYVVLLQPYIFAAGVEELGVGGLVVSTLYPLGDVFFMLAPALALALTIRELGAGKLAWPWWIVVVGALVFAVADSAYSYVDWSGGGTNTLLDIGWMTANLLFAIAALVARDVYHTR